MSKTNFNLKKLLKSVKLHESTISMFLGLIVVLVVGSLVVKSLKIKKIGVLPKDSISTENSVTAKPKTHKVKKGENLWSISVKYYGDGFKWIDIATENKLENASIIEVDQELVIPEIETITKTETENPITTSTYEVTKGDTLWSIALRAYGDGYQWVKIASENKLSHPNLIHTGNVIIIPR